MRELDGTTNSRGIVSRHLVQNVHHSSEKLAQKGDKKIMETVENQLTLGGTESRYYCYFIIEYEEC